MTPFRLRIMAQVLPFLLIAPGMALAQTAPSRAEAMAVANPAATPDEAVYTTQQIDQLIAPIALYPDQLLVTVLMAATYPQQIADAAQWLQDPAHAALKGDALVAALEPLPWEPSVKSLVAFPQLIVMLNDHLEWTQALGVAFAAQQPTVMARVQVLRHLAMRSGRLKTVKHLTIRQEGNDIVIVSAEPDRVYVPVYNPVVVYGEWPDRAYPPVYIPPPPTLVVVTREPGFALSAGYAVVGPLWGWSRPDWRQRTVTINRVEYTRITRNVEIGPRNEWRHHGPVVLAAPATARPAPNRAAAAPAGTVDPRAAAAVRTLPQHAARHPNLIETHQAASRPGAENPAERQPAGTQPATARPGQTGPATNPAAAARAPQPAAERNRNGTTATAPAGEARRAEPERNRPSANGPAAAAHETAKPSGAPETTRHPAERAATPTPATEQHERARGEARQAPEQRGEHPRHEPAAAPEHATSRGGEPGRAAEHAATPQERQPAAAAERPRTAPSEAAGQHREATRPAAEPPAAAAHRPEAGGAAAAAHRPEAAARANGEGSTAHGAAHHEAAPRPTHEPAAGSEPGEKKER